MPVGAHGGKRVTRADVAQLAGVSTAVVSYVLNDTGSVSAATRQRVREAIDMLGYQPNVNARALATGSSRLIGFIVPGLSNPFFGEFAVAVEAAAAARGYSLLITSAEGDEEVERRHIQNLIERRVDGLLVGGDAGHAVVALTAASGIRTVLFNVFDERPGLVTVGPDAAEGARAATSHLIAHGHTEIGLVIGAPETGGMEAREAGWLRALGDAGLAPGPIGRAEFDRAGGYSAARQIFAAERRPTALFASSDLQAVGALAALHELGLRVPQDVSIVSFDGSEETEYSIPALTTVRQPVAEMSAKLIELVLMPEPPSGHHSFPARLVLRASCGEHAADGTPLR